MDKNKTSKIVTSASLHEEWTKERESKGLKEIKPINNAAGTSTNNLASMDKSWKNVPDFFKQMVKGNEK